MEQIDNADKRTEEKRLIYKIFFRITKTLLTVTITDILTIYRLNRLQSAI